MKASCIFRVVARVAYRKARCFDALMNRAVFGLLGKDIDVRR